MKAWIDIKGACTFKITIERCRSVINLGITVSIVAVSVPTWEHSLHSIRAFLLQDRRSVRPSVHLSSRGSASQSIFIHVASPSSPPSSGWSAVPRCSPLPDHCRARRSRNLIIFSAEQTTEDDICLARALMSVWFGGELAII